MKTRPLCFVCLLFILIQSVLMIAKSGDSLYEIPASSIFYEREEKTLEITGQVYKKTNTSNYQVLYLKNNSISDSKILVYDETFTEIPVGKKITIRGSLGFFDKARNPGNFDQELYYARQKVYGYVWCKEILEICGESNLLLEELYQFKLKWKTILTDGLGKKNGALLSAMLLGDKSEMDAEIKELYQKAGIGHILAISGLHISFIGLGIYKFIRKIGLGFWPSGLLAIGTLTLYAFMIGFSVSVFRAFLMLLLRIVADICGRVYDMLTALMLAAALTVFYQPLYLTDAGFWMSYGAILGILLVLPALKKTLCVRWEELSKKCTGLCSGIIYLLLSAVFSALLSSLAVNLILFPILLWFYFEFPTYSLLLNMIVIPLMSLVLGFGMLGSLLTWFIPGIGIWCLKLCDLILEFYECLSRWENRLPMARMVLGKPEWWEVILYYVSLGFILLCVYRGAILEGKSKHRKQRKYIWLALGISLFFMAYRPHGNLTVSMLDVGQGDCIFLCGPAGNKYLIDGGSSDVEQVGKYRIEPFLKSQGVGEVDYVFLTHGDKDHYSGILEMLERQEVGVRIRNLVLPANYKQDAALTELVGIARNVGVHTLVMHEGDCLYEGEGTNREVLQLTCLQPSVKDDKLSGNAGSLVLDVTYGAFSMLCTGDVEAEGEEMLVKKLRGKDYDVLKVAHHGSKNSTSQEFLKVTKPEIALISVGKDNSYGHPHLETIKRLENAQNQVFYTMRSGLITLKVNKDKIAIISYVRKENNYEFRK